MDKFPVINKQIIRDNFSDFTSDIKDYFPHGDAYTGGSTGEPFHFLSGGLYERDFGRKRWKEYGFHFGDKLIAMDGTKITDEFLNKNIYWKKTEIT